MTRPASTMRAGSRAAFTLIELMIACAILAGLVLATMMIVVRSSAVSETDALINVLESDARRAVDQIAHDLRQAGETTLVPTAPTNATSLAFKTNLGYSLAGVQWGPLVTYAVAYENGETNNGVDDNRNGLIDESVVTRSVSGGAATTIVRYVRENGLNFTWNAATSTLQIRLTLERLGPDNRPVSRTASTSVMLRN
ncbi:MAG: prepilin-type N-terminal cleavage/methylation domain-containing protein [Planctomycetes bacterium]|nr:prepilin-type N-terminal cleavage/methylation domain-containing protein [Planctomycetota bacterium]